jgi:predicted PurR-regulated permease PerM
MDPRGLPRNLPEESLMSSHFTPEPAFEKRIASWVLDVLIRAGLILAMVTLCYKFFAPFLPMTVWALILSVTLYPLHQIIAGRLGGRQGLASTLLVILGLALLVAPTAVLMSSLGDSVEQLVHNVQANALEIPAPRDSVANWPVIGKRVHAIWSQAHSDLPSLVQSLQPKIGELAKATLGFVAGIGGALLQFLLAFIIAGIIMAYGRSGGRAIDAIFRRVAGKIRGAQFAKLSVATIRAVAVGVIGIAFIQAIIVGLSLLIAGVPWAGALALITLVLGIAQVPALIVTLPAIAYIWWSGDYGNVAAIAYTLLLLVAGMVDNVLKPLMLGRGVDAPMPVILLGALGGMAAAGILGMFIGATLFALGYEIFMGWVAGDPEEEAPEQDADTSPAQ